MINIQFKDCCKECPNLYVLTETETTESVVSEGPIEVKANIYCSHMYVCKKYNEYEGDR